MNDHLISRIPSTIINVLPVFLIAFSLNISAQPNFKHSNAIEVIENGNSLSIAWAGGMNNPEFSSIDLDNDGTEDLFVFDRTNSKAFTLRHSGTPNSLDYDLDFSYDEALPRLTSWALLRDYDCDGLVDIFTNETGGLRVYKNTSTFGNPSFEILDSKIQSTFELGDNPFEAFIYIGSDIPAIDDIDDDGDMDIVCFSQSGNTVQLFLNQSIELYGNCDSLAFTLANNCYGWIYESSMDETITLGYDSLCTLNVNNPIRISENSDDSARSGQHVGSSLCTFDSDQNGYKDILIGDISGNEFVLINMGPSSTNLDSAYIATTPYPANNPVDTDFFPTGYYVDVDNDGIKDLLASPSNDVESEDLECSYFYKNNGENDLVDFSFQGNDFLVNEMIDAGSGSFPHLVDYNGDNKMDLLISNKGFYQPGGDYISQFILYENTGTLQDPVFTLVDDDYLGFSTASSQRYLFPTFGDLDGDQDTDMIIGDEEGVLTYYENIAGVGAELNFAQPQIMEDDENLVMDIGINASPQLFDLNEDGLLDLIVGERNTTINYYENTGSIDNWSFELVNDSLGGMDIDEDGDLLGYSVPFAFYHNDEVHIIVGSDKGNLFHYDGISNNIDGEFNLISSEAYGLKMGKRSSPFLYDINNDNLIDMFIGNFSGGLDLFMGDFPASITEAREEKWFSMYPNPSSDVLNVKFLKESVDDFNIEIYDVTGSRLYFRTLRQRQTHTINTSSWANGVYIVRITADGKATNQKLVIRH